MWVAAADGTDTRQVSPPAGSGGLFPFWLPDGKSIGYTRLKKDAERLEIVSVPAERLPTVFAIYSRSCFLFLATRSYGKDMCPTSWKV